jgi:pimeloyl-ACP methyl ester carboxylesterase
MKARNIILFGMGLILIFVSVYQLYGAQKGLQVVDLHTTNPPTTIIAPIDNPASRPTILIAHGFAGSAVLMRGFALTLAHAGYTTVLWDFEGHGTNPNPLLLTNEPGSLLKDAESALSYAAETGLVNTQKVAILGHSMGSGVALDYGVTYSDTFATIAISPVSRTVTAELPHNLLLMAGSLEPQFADNAKHILATAGGANNDFASGIARQLTIIPNVEHISILFSPIAHSTTVSWLNSTFGPQPGATSYTDTRILWFILGILGFIFVANASVNSLPFHALEIKPSSIWLRIAAIITGGVAATIILWLVSLAGVKISQMLGLLVGGYLLIWFGIAGVISLLILRPHIYLPKLNEIIKGVIIFAGLWLGAGLLGNFVWLPWLLIPARLILWVPGAIMLLPWFYAVGEASKPAKPWGQVGWWLAEVVTVIVGFFLALTINPELGFIFLILPLIPVILGLHKLSISSRHGTWAFALPGAMFTAWLLLAVFPL